MRSDGQTYLRCEECGEYVNSSEAGAHRCAEPTAAGNEDDGNRTLRGRLSALFAGMERHGNAEGTEAQLGDAEEFLRLAFDGMSPAQQTGFLNSRAVSEFIAREPESDDDESSEHLVCGICGDRVDGDDLREHLTEHNPNAGAMDWEDVRNVFTLSAEHPSLPGKETGVR